MIITETRNARRYSSFTVQKGLAGLDNVARRDRKRRYLLALERPRHGDRHLGLHGLEDDGDLDRVERVADLDLEGADRGR